MATLAQRVVQRFARFKAPRQGFPPDVQRLAKKWTADIEQKGHDIGNWALRFKSIPKAGWESACLRCNQVYYIVVNDPSAKSAVLTENGVSLSVTHPDVFASDWAASSCDVEPLDLVRGMFVLVDDPATLLQQSPSRIAGTLIKAIEAYGGLGEYWTAPDNRSVAERYAVRGIDGKGLPVILHGQFRRDDQPRNFKRSPQNILVEYEHEREVFFGKHETLRVQAIEWWDGKQWAMQAVPNAKMKTSARVVLRWRTAMTFDTLNITSQNLKEVLDNLVAGVDDLDAAEQLLQVDLRQMTKVMQELPHNNDQYHNGEDVLQHIGWVLDDVQKLSGSFDQETQVLLRLTALFHDLGKAFTYKFDPEKQKHTFYNHATKSVQIAEVLLKRHQQQLGSLYQHVIDFTRLHDAFLQLAHERAKQPGGSTRYVRKLMQEQVYHDGLIEHLLTFARADSYRARSHQEKIKDIEGVLLDIKRAEQEQVDQLAAAARQQALTIERMPQIQQLLEQAAPDAAAALPDLQQAKRLLGQSKRYDLLKAIERLTKD